MRKCKKCFRFVICFGGLLLMSGLSTGATSMGSEVSVLIEELRTADDDYERLCVIQHIEALELDGAPAVPELVRALKDPDKNVRNVATRALKSIGPEASEAIPALVELLGQDGIPEIETSFGPIIYVGISAASTIGVIDDPKSVPLLRACLDDKNPAVRTHATYALGLLGSHAKPATADIMKLLGDKEAAVRAEAVRTIGKIGVDAKLVTGPILKTLDDEKPGVRIAAIRTLGAIRPVLRPALDGLIRSLGDSDGRIQACAANALGGLGKQASPAVAELSKTLSSRNGYRYSHHGYGPVASAAARALWKIGPSAKSAMPSLLATIMDVDATYDRYAHPESKRPTRAVALLAAVRIDPNNKQLSQLIGKCLEDKALKFEDQAVKALGIMGPKAKRYLPKLIELIELNEKSDYRYRLERGYGLALAALRIDPDNAIARRALLAGLLDVKDEEIFLYSRNVPWDTVHSSLRRSNKDKARVIEMLIREFKKEDPEIKCLCIALSEFGPDAKNAVPTLIKALDEVRYNKRPVIESALRKIAGPKSPPLLAALTDDKPVVRVAAVKALGQFPETLPQVVHAMKDPSARVRFAAVEAISHLNKISQLKGVPLANIALTITHLQELSHDNRRVIREAAQRTKEQILKGQTQRKRKNNSTNRDNQVR